MNKDINVNTRYTRVLVSELGILSNTQLFVHMKLFVVFVGKSYTHERKQTGERRQKVALFNDVSTMYRTKKKRNRSDNFLLNFN